MHSLSRKVKIIILSLIAAVLIAALAVTVVLILFKNHPVPANVGSDYIGTSSLALSSEETSSQEEPADNGVGLVVASPEQATFTTTTPFFTLSGSSDPNEPLTVNNTEITRDENGYFALDMPLDVGKNVFTLSHKGETKTYTVTYRYIVINSYSPSGNQRYGNGAKFGVSVSARKDSVVTAAFNGVTIRLNPSPYLEEGDVFVDYIGEFTLPSDNLNDINLGKVKFTGTQNGVTEVFYSGTITCKKPTSILDNDPAVTPAGGKYVNVGSGIIAEIIHTTAETFDAFSTNDWSSPLNNYLPKGTVDYVIPEDRYVYYTASGGVQKEYAVLRYGKQVYTKIKDKPGNNSVQIIKVYKGTLPDHNEIEVSSVNEDLRFTKLNFKCLFKAPFYFDLLNQKYANPNLQNFSVSNVTFSYVDITFCYATVFEGEINISPSNPLFSSAEIIKNQSDFTLRLHLKKQGGFYGWDAYYNADGELCFEFLHPARVSAADNPYGISLAGVTVLVDPGHNGTADTGALCPIDKNYTEAERNLNLAKKVKAKLEELGATVIMMRDNNASPITYQGRIEKLKSSKPDFCISIHHDSSVSSTAKGYTTFYGTPFSKSAAQFIDNRTYNANIYAEIDPMRWHYFFLARVTNCPVVLTENGFISNANDFSGIKDETVNNKKADAIVAGIVDYFRSIQ